MLCSYYSVYSIQYSIEYTDLEKWYMNITGEAFPNFELQPGGVLMKGYGEFCAHGTVMLISRVL